MKCVSYNVEYPILLVTLINIVDTIWILWAFALALVSRYSVMGEMRLYPTIISFILGHVCGILLINFFKMNSKTDASGCSLNFLVISHVFYYILPLVIFVLSTFPCLTFNASNHNTEMKTGLRVSTPLQVDHLILTFSASCSCSLLITSRIPNGHFLMGGWLINNIAYPFELRVGSLLCNTFTIYNILSEFNFAWFFGNHRDLMAKAALAPAESYPYPAPTKILIDYFPKEGDQAQDIIFFPMKSKWAAVAIGTSRIWVYVMLLVCHDVSVLIPGILDNVARTFTTSMRIPPHITTLIVILGTAISVIVLMSLAANLFLNIRRCEIATRTNSMNFSNRNKANHWQD